MENGKWVNVKRVDLMKIHEIHFNHFRVVTNAMGIESEQHLPNL